MIYDMIDIAYLHTTDIGTQYNFRTIHERIRSRIIYRFALEIEI